MTNKPLSQLTSGSAVSSTDLFPDIQTAGAGPVKVTAAQIGDYVLSGSGLTGTLPVARGGTGLTSLAAGRIPFGAGTSAFGNSANLFWDNTNTRLGINISSPSAKLVVAGTSNAYVGAASNAIYNIQVSETNQFLMTGIVSTGTASTSYSWIQSALLPIAASPICLQPGGGSVGIGVTNPGRTLSVSTSSDTSIQGISTTANSYIQFTGSSASSYIGQASGSIVFLNPTTERMRIDSSGNVGIGNTNPTSRLAIYANLTGALLNPIGATYVINNDVTGIAQGIVSSGSTQAGSNTISNWYHFRAYQGTIGAGSSVINQIGFLADSSMTGATNNYGFYGNIASGTGRWNFYAAGTADNYFAGNVGIGVAPTQKLDVSNNANSGTLVKVSNPNVGASAYTGFNLAADTASATLFAASSGAANPNSVFLRLDSGTGGLYLDTATAAPIIFRTNSLTERMRINSSGNVGIGTSNPSQKLDVYNGNISVYSTGTVDALYSMTQTSGANTPNAWFGLPSWNKSTFYLFGPTAAGNEAALSYGSATWVFNTGGSERMRIDSSGNVGIGNTSPAVSLDIGGSGTPQVRLVSTTNAVDTRLLSIGASNVGIVGTISNHAFVVYTNNTERLRITSAGSVLIGTSTAGASKLTVADDSIQINTAKTPASATATGTTGQVCWDASYIYVCTATNTWKRAAIATW